MRLSAVERKVLNSIQADIPIARRPFKVLSGRIGIGEEEFLGCVKDLMTKGIIRNFQAHLDHRRLGFKSTLVALKVPADEVEKTALEISGYPEVTHCYLRDGEYNLWAVFICSDENRLRGFLNKLAKNVGRQNMLNLVTKRQFKLKTALSI